MKLILKENPREWQKFTWVMVLAIGLLCCVSYFRHVLSPVGAVSIAGTAALAGLACLVYPRPFRSFYRFGMTVSFHVGQCMGKVLLTVFFVLAVTPLGLFLRLMGKDLLQLKKPNTNSYWQPARPNPHFDRMF